MIQQVVNDESSKNIFFPVTHLTLLHETIHLPKATSINPFVFAASQQNKHIPFISIYVRLH